MNKIKTDIEDLIIIEPTVYGDNRGFFFESWNQNKFNQLIGYDVNFVQDNHSKSDKGVLRGLHFQLNNMQAKLVRVVKGSVLDVVVDLRLGSQTFGKTFKILLSEENKKQIYIPKGFAHGFITLENGTEFLYKCDDYYDPSSEYSIIWNDKLLDIDWNNEEPILSDKDKKGISLLEAKKLLLEC